MEKEFVPYEQALALKELGFDEPCFGYYVPLLDNTQELEIKLIQTNGNKIVIAPLYQQAFSFLLNIIKDVSITYWNDESGNLKYFGQVNPFYDFDNRKECLSVLIEIAKKN